MEAFEHLLINIHEYLGNNKNTLYGYLQISKSQFCPNKIPINYLSSNCQLFISGHFYHH